MRGFTIDKIDLFYVQHSIGWQDKHTLTTRKDDRDYITHCFADPQTASYFQALFGGELTSLPKRVS